jgi:hypothetical protein
MTPERDHPVVFIAASSPRTTNDGATGGEGLAMALDKRTKIGIGVTDTVVALGGTALAVDLAVAVDSDGDAIG